MKSFVVRVFSFFLIVAVLLSGVIVYHRSSVYWDKNYMLSFRLKHERAKSLAGPKILFVGGSNNAFGWDSGLVSRELDKQVVNMGYYAGKGLDYRLNEIRPYVKEGDVIVLCLEYQVWHGLISGPLLWDTLYADFRAVRFFSPQTWKEFADWGFLFGLRKTINESVEALVGKGASYDPDAFYNIDWFNEYGDVIKHWTMERKSRIPLIKAFIEPDERSLKSSIAKVNRFARFCAKRGAKVVVYHPQLPRDTFEADRDAFIQTVEEIEEGASFAILNDIDDVVWAEDQFFDSNYHLIGEAVQRRSRDFVSRYQALAGK